MISSTHRMLAMARTAMRACWRPSCQVDTPTAATSTANIPRTTKVPPLNSSRLQLCLTATSGRMRTGKVVTAAALLKINIRAPLDNSPGRQTINNTFPAIIRGRISLQPMATSRIGRSPVCHNKQRAHTRKHRNRLHGRIQFQQLTQAYSHLMTHLRAIPLLRKMTDMQEFEKKRWGHERLEDV
jgi:hypothetical protein